MDHHHPATRYLDRAMAHDDPLACNDSIFSKDDFLEAVKKRLNPVGETKFELETGVLTALNVIKKHTSAGEMDDLVAVVEPSLKTFINRKPTHSEVSV